MYNSTALWAADGKSELTEQIRCEPLPFQPHGEKSGLGCSQNARDRVLEDDFQAE